ncbi:nucleoside diphosphate kinase regulator [Ectothiorhodospiraceae bacterium 2226]|nr:nucleoside diphosphate kinase regulator [Ectothiorhodospiraceae bacterium 2226]
MSQLPPITVSAFDLDRLEALLDKLPKPASPEINALRAELARANIVEPEEMPPTVVTMNSRVRFAVEGTDETFEKVLCYPRDIDGQPDKISVLAPLGSAMLGLSVGQQIAWPLPGRKTVQVRIEEVLYQPERAGDYNR